MAGLLLRQGAQSAQMLSCASRWPSGISMPVRSSTWQFSGRLEGSRKTARVSSVARASGEASRAARAADGAPRCASATARSARGCASESAEVAGLR